MRLALGNSLIAANIGGALLALVVMVTSLPTPTENLAIVGAFELVAFDHVLRRHNARRKAARR